MSIMGGWALPDTTFPFFVYSVVRREPYPRLPATKMKAVQKGALYVEFRAPPPNLAGMVSQSDVVLIGTVKAAVPEPRDSGPLTTLNTIEVRTVLTSLQTAPTVAASISVSHLGGSKDHGSFIEEQEVPDFPPLRVGHTYLLFLKWHVGTHEWSDAFGPPSIIDLTSAIAHIQASSPLHDMDGTSSETLIESIRRTVPKPPGDH